MVSSISIPGNAIDLFPLNGESNEANINRLGGFGSDLFYDSRQNLFYGVADRRPGGGVIPYQTRVEQFDINIDPQTGAINGYQLLKTIPFTIAAGTTFNGITYSTTTPFNGLNPQVLNGDGTKLGLSQDPEGFVVGANGNFYVSDEYGPSIYEFSPTGTFIRALTEPDNVIPKNGSNPYFAANGVTLTTGRQDNRGYEGLAISPDGKKLFSIFQDPLQNEGSPNGRSSGNVRIVRFDIATGKSEAQYIYQLESVAHINARITATGSTDTFASTSQGRNIGVSSLTAINDHEFLVIERDNRGIGTGDPTGETTVGTKRIYKIDLTGATDVSSVNLTGTNTLPTGVKPVSKSLFLDIAGTLESAGQKVPEKFEGLAIGPQLADGSYALVLATDNDFSITQNSTNTQFDVYTNGVSSTQVPIDSLPPTAPAGESPYTLIPSYIYSFNATIPNVSLPTLPSSFNPQEPLATTHDKCGQPCFVDPQVPTNIFDEGCPHLSREGLARFGQFKSVLLLSIDGLRQADLTDPNLQAYLPNIAFLEKTGITYNNAYTTIPSDSFPGTLAYTTGAGPATTGVYYDASYDRNLKAPGSNTFGTEVLFDEAIDKNASLLNGGGIDPSKLPIDANGNLVYPHDYLKVNTIFEVAKDAGLSTAYAEKHPAYDLLNGPSGKGIDDLYTPEIAASVAIVNGQLVDKSTAPAGTTLKGVNKSVQTTELYDDLKLKAVLNQINGLTSDGKTYLDTNNNGVQDANEATLSGAPAIFGMNFQAVSVAQKLPGNGIAADGTPSPGFIDALRYTDASIGKIIDALKQDNLFDSTLIVVTAKHGQNPRLGSATLIPEDTFTTSLEAAGINVVNNIPDDASILWLEDPTQASKAKDILTQLNNPNVEQILVGDDLVKFGFGNPLTDNRAPSLVVQLKPGVVLVSDPSNPSKIAEHGGYSEDDTHVPLILSSGGLNSDVKGSVVNDQVSNKQIAVTTLEALGLDPDKLQGAKAEGTTDLPGIGFNLIRGTEQDDTLYGGNGDDIIFSLASNDTIYAGEGNNSVIAGNGNNTVYAGAGNDVINVGNGNNTIYAAEGNNNVFAGNGNDLIYAGLGDDIINAGDGNNTIYAAEGNNQITTGIGDDLIYAGSGNNLISTGTGNDTVYVGSGLNRFILAAGLDSATIYGFTSNDQISRGAGLSSNASLTVSISGNDTLISAGSDLLATLKWTQLNSVNIV